MRLLVNDQLDGVAVGELLDQSFRELTLNGSWAALKYDGVLTTTPKNITGTLTATNGSLTVTGAGTTFAATDVGSYLHLDGIPYVVSSVAAQVLTLSSPYIGTTGAGKGVALTKPMYELEPGLDLLLSINGPSWPIYEQTQNWIDSADPLRQSEGQPYVYMFRQVGAAGGWQLELWPTPTEAFRIVYLGLSTGTAPTKTTPIHTDFAGVLVKRTGALACQALMARTKEAQWQTLYQTYMGEAQQALLDLKRKNRRRFGIDTYRFPRNLDADPQLDLYGAPGGIW